MAFSPCGAYAFSGDMDRQINAAELQIPSNFIEFRGFSWRFAAFPRPFGPAKVLDGQMLKHLNSHVLSQDLKCLAERSPRRLRSAF